ncbi:MAG: asparagine synthase (glutamine-hydrolyzing) [Myxococcota bacterium]
MCGIAGIAGPPGQPIARELLERMTRTLSHRGPDGEGYFFDVPGGAALGHRRLSIIDLEGGAQPQCNEDGSVQTVVNGEIYNFQRLREELISRGHRMRTRSDCEVVAHGYEEWGTQVFEKIDGMFAAAIWDAKKRRLLLARDRMGKKPLYYALVGRDRRTLIFGSELSALAAHPDLDRGVSPTAFAAYLTYESFPESMTAYAEARKLLPGTWLEHDADRGITSTQQFWELRYGDAPSVPDISEWGEDRIAGHLRDLIRDATEARLISDVPLGVFLSGGIDSSTVAAAMAELVPPKEIKTFSITFDDPSFDEGPYARMVAQHLGTDHHEERLSPQVMIDILPTIADFMSEPIGDASVIPTYLLSRFARRTVTVALGGDGGDELFLGYPTFVADKMAQRLDALLPQTATRHLGDAMGWAARMLPVSRKNFSLDFKIKRFAQGLGYGPEARHQAWMGSFLTSEMREIMTPEVAAMALSRDPYMLLEELKLKSGARDHWDALMAQYMRFYLTACVLVKVDRASMAASLEVRAPLLDTKVVEFAAALPGHLKVRRNVTKYILKKAVRPWLPAEIIDRPKKGFGIPIADWLRGPLRSLAFDTLSPARLKREGLLRPEVVTRLLDEHDRGVADHRKQLWTLLAFHLWLERFGPEGRRIRGQTASHAPAHPSSVVLRM